GGRRAGPRPGDLDARARRVARLAHALGGSLAGLARGGGALRGQFAERLGAALARRLRRRDPRLALLEGVLVAGLDGPQVRPDFLAGGVAVEELVEGGLAFDRVHARAQRVQPALPLDDLLVREGGAHRVPGSLPFRAIA